MGMISSGNESGSDSSSSSSSSMTFAVFQTVSLVAAACTSISNPNVAKAARGLMSRPLETSTDNLALQQLVPLVLGVLWLFLTHLRNNMGSMIAVLGLSSLVSPKVIASVWPAMAGLLGSASSLADA